MSQFEELGKKLGEKIRPRLGDRLMETQLAALGDQAGTVKVPDRAGFVYVRIRSTAETIPVFNPRKINAPAGTEVRIGYSEDNPRILTVLGIAYDARGQVDNWTDDDGELPDYVDRSVPIAYIRDLHPHRGSTDFALEVYAGWVFDGSDMRYFTSGQIDLADEQPTSGELYVHVYLDPTAEDLDGTALGYEVGEVFSALGPGGVPATLPPIDERIPNVPDGMYPIAAVRLYASQTLIDNKDIVHTRKAFEPSGLASGGAGGGDSTYKQLMHPKGVQLLSSTGLWLVTPVTEE
jgi:hypothetical protein